MPFQLMQQEIIARAVINDPAIERLQGALPSNLHCVVTTTHLTKRELSIGISIYRLSKSSERKLQKNEGDGFSVGLLVVFYFDFDGVSCGAIEWYPAASSACPTRASSKDFHGCARV